MMLYVFLNKPIKLLHQLWKIAKAQVVTAIPNSKV